MKELALHILDIAQNSIRAEATLIEITIKEDITKDIFSIEIKDNGIGMDEETLKRVEDPFFTTRNTRKIGLGVSLLKTAALQCEGSFNILSKKRMGTILTVVFKHSHIDRAPLGSIEDTIVTLLMMEKEVDYIYNHHYNNNSFSFNTKEVKAILQGLPITDIKVIDWIKRHVADEIKDIVNS
ncbi:Histidine kinase-, DNA gyrase B-, and HSP90-like ATPase [Anaerovirgula multivorans]|uniref:histidine kinase n=1 Tax=Anaerovirgula multivorans TaxID=312168 RepID=A0A239DUZ9_9FIRM|nr:ATP-binding protein [Anaerovirgula multivorans]SNS35582.1 Histidine kinase-, DNA gyrase B-, and HSP90-like ATPase [Anaerovirgula multivorans]